MPRTRGSEMPQRQPLRGPHALRTSSSDSDSLRHRPITDRSPKIGDRHLSRVPQPDSLNQKKLGTRIADLESQLTQAQEELKILKNKLASAEVARKAAPQQQEKKIAKLEVPEPEKIQDKHSSTEVPDLQVADTKIVDEVANEKQKETDVFEVPLEQKTVETKIDPDCYIYQMENANKADATSSHELALKDDEICMLKAKLAEKEKELEVHENENKNLKNQLKEAISKHTFAKAKEEELSVTLSQLNDKLEASKENAAKLKEKLDVVDGVKGALEAEMKTMRVQTEQWRKAADAAAAVLARGMETSDRISGRCSSMDQHFGGIFETSSSGYTGFVGSPGITEECDDSFRSAKQRSASGIKAFGDLWRRKSQK